jgi:hypothetical protein
MELNELKGIWQQYDEKLERSLKLNQKCMEQIQAQKTRSKLAPLLRIRIFEMTIHALVIWWLAGFLTDHLLQWKFAAAATVLIIFFSMSFLTCLKQVSIIKGLDYGDDIITIQSSLVMLQTHNADYIRLSFLVIPTYLAYPLIVFKAMGDFDISQVNADWWLAQLIFSLLILFPSIWMYRQLSYHNIYKPWVQKLLKKLSGKYVTDAMSFVREMELIKQEIA